MKRMIALVPVVALAACSVSDDEMRAASAGATGAVIAADVNDEYRKTQDFDSIAAESLEGVDTTGFDALAYELLVFAQADVHEVILASMSGFIQIGHRARRGRRSSPDVGRLSLRCRPFRVRNQPSIPYSRSLL